MQTKDEYLAQLKAQLDEWASDLDHLRDKAADASDDVRETVEQQIAELKAKWDDGAARRQEILDTPTTIGKISRTRQRKNGRS